MGILTEKEVYSVLEAVNNGDLTVEKTTPKSWQEMFCGDCTFHLSNGWKVTVFNDCGDWDYIDNVISDDGRSVDFDGVITGWSVVDLIEPHVKAWGLDK